MDPLTLIGAIPTALNTIQSLGSLFSKPYNPPKQYQENSREVFKQGGKIRGQNNYDAPSHQQGGQLVNDQGIPSPTGTNEVEKKESKYTYSNIKNESYIFTPEDAKKLNKLTKKYKNANTSQLEKNGLELEIQRIENTNEMKKKQQAKKQFKNGGKIKKYNSGGPINPINPLGGLSGLRSALGQYAKTRIEDQVIKPLPRNKDLNMTFDGKSTEKKGYFNQDFSSSSTTPPKTSEGTSNPLKTLDTLRNVTLAGSSLGLLKGTEKENPIMTNYGPARKELNNLSANLDPLKQQIAQSSNQLRNVNRNSASSYNSFANREAQRVGNQMQSLQGVSLQERQLENQIAGQKSQFESNVARDNSQTLKQNREANLQNEAVADTNRENIGKTILKDIDRRSTIQNNKNFASATTREQISLLNTMFPNIEVGQADVDIILKEGNGETLTAEEKTRKLELMKFKI
jgi:hypothetical protein